MKNGDTMTGPLNFANNTWNILGDDVMFGDRNIGGKFFIRGLNGDTGIRMASYTDESIQGEIMYNGMFHIKDAGLWINQPTGNVLLSSGTLSTSNKQVVNVNDSYVYFGNPESTTMLEGFGLCIPINTILRGSVSGNTLTINIG